MKETNDFPKGTYKWVTFNDTEGLQPVKLSIEKIIRWGFDFYNEPLYIPPIEKMYNYNLPREEQYFHRPEEPIRLQQLLKHARREVRKGRTADSLPEQLVILYMRKYLKEHAKEYIQEIQWIQSMWYHRLFGYWFINNGKPTYITGSHFNYLFSYDLGGVGLPDYRDIDRKVFLIDEYCFLAKETFEKLDENGVAIPEADGSYKMKPTKNRTIIGTMHPKSRREGSTQKYMSKLLDIMTLVIGADCIGAIQSFGGTSSSQMYENKLLAAFKKKPFFFKPIWSGTNTPKEKLKFSADSSDFVDTELECTIIPATTVDRKTFDGLKLFYYHADESAKVPDSDILRGWGIVRLCLMQGEVIHGFASHPSTVEEITGENADRYEQLFFQSDFYKRDRLSGMTQSGLVAYFFDAAEFYTEGFLDKYGFTVTGKPTPEQAEFIGKDYGSIEALESTAAQILKSDSLDKEREYRDERRRHPRTIKDVFLSSSGDIGFNLTKLDNRNTELKELERNDPVVKIGMYRWKNGVVDGEVEIYEDEKGWWEFSDDCPIHIRNKKVRTAIYDPIKESMQPSYIPAYPGTFISSSDPYKFSERDAKQLAKDKNKLSLGACNTLMDRLETDTDDKPIEEWEGMKFTASFLGRFTDEDEFAEQVLMNSVYWGAFHYPEINLEVVWKHFVKRGYKGYLMYDFDKKTSSFKKFPGFNSTHRKNELFKSLNFFIEYRIHQECHRRFIEQAIRIRSMKEMGDYDLITVFGGALMGLQNESWQMVRKLNVTKKFTKSHFY